MVIYWHGFVQSLTRLNDENIFISDKFPEHWIFPSGELADGSVPEFDTLVCKRDCTGVGCTCSNCTVVGCTDVDCTGEG